MVPTKFPSVRHKSRPAMRAPFRDDTGLVALRYEKTVPAEPPIPVLSSRLSRRSTRPTSSSSSSNKSRRSQQHHHRPIVIAPPLPIVPPPAEQHPALRPTVPTPVEEWKRDSGVARTNSSATIREPDCEFEFHFLKVDEVTSDPAVSPTVQRMPDPFVEQEDIASVLANHLRQRRRSQTMTETPCTTPSLFHTDVPQSPSLPSAPLSPLSVASAPLPCSAAFTAISATAAAATAPLDTASATSTAAAAAAAKDAAHPQTAPRLWLPSPPSPKKLAKTLSFRSSSRIQTKGSGEAQIAKKAAPMKPLGAVRGFPAPTKPKALPMAPDDFSQNGNNQSGEEAYSTFSSSPSPSDDVFSPLAIAIPTDGIFEDDFMSSLTFSNRGSIMIGGRRASAGLDGTVDQHPPEQQPLDLQQREGEEELLQQGEQQPPPPLSSHDDGNHPDVNTDEDSNSNNNNNNDNNNDNDNDNHNNTTTNPTPARESLAQSSVETVETDDTPATEDLPSEPAPQPGLQLQTGSQSRGLMPPPDIRVLAADVEKESQKVRSLYAVGDGLHWEDGARHSYCERLEPTPEAPSEDNFNDPLQGHLTPAWGTPRSGSSFSQHHDALRREYELAGGLEDWEDIDGAHVDRYGFINLPRPNSRIGTPTDLKSSQFSPRRRNGFLKRETSSASSPLATYRTRPPSRKVSARSLNTVTSELSMTSMRSSRSVIRQAANLLPHNRDRRWMDEAGDMLNIAPGIDLEEEIKAEKITETLKRKEWERSEKWRRMAKVVRKGTEGQGMEFEFDMKNQKLIERTWKGIPDRWRAAAWWSFLASTAREDPNADPEEQIMAGFHKLQHRSSPDDVQIDLDVPRTISRHIMFRRRYRGGQRLLFRVLHALSIYFPETGYVQGMASLAATLLCYFDEEKCFVMLVRMWKYRGLELLYRPGFEDLIKELGEFNERWINKEVAAKLAELVIDPTAYGTRWYLTLFNLSIPFPAQLRVWDVFLLYGDGSPNFGESQSKNSGSKNSPTSGYDILHATSAALIQALREVLLDSDFENAMKALTSWIPIKDEDLLMKVAKAEWKTHKGKKRA